MTENEYQQTKLVRQGKREMHTQIRPLAKWINQEYMVNTLNIFYDRFGEENKHRLQIIFEFSKDSKGFFNEYGYDKNKQEQIRKYFINSLQDQRIKGKMRSFNLFKRIFGQKIQSEEWLITFRTFESISRQKIMEKLQQSELKELKDKINDKNLWTIRTDNMIPVFFLYKDNQVKEYQKEGMIEKWENLFFTLLKKHNEFEYFDKELFNVKLESKENFDTNFSSNFYYYFK
jgi:hypothetical protein